MACSCSKNKVSGVNSNKIAKVPNKGKIVTPKGGLKRVIRRSAY